MKPVLNIKFLEYYKQKAQKLDKVEGRRIALTANLNRETAEACKALCKEIKEMIPLNDWFYIRNIELDGFDATYNPGEKSFSWDGDYFASQIFNGTATVKIIIQSLKFVEEFLKNPPPDREERNQKIKEFEGLRAELISKLGSGKSKTAYSSASIINNNMFFKKKADEMGFDFTFYTPLEDGHAYKLSLKIINVFINWMKIYKSFTETQIMSFIIGDLL